MIIFFSLPLSLFLCISCLAENSGTTFDFVECECELVSGFHVEYGYIYIYIYRVSQEECARLREGVPYVKLYRKTPKHLYPKLNGLADNGQ